MALENRQILSGIRIGSDVFTHGQQDELAAALTNEQGQRLLEAGALAGDWSFGGNTAPIVNKAPELTAKAK